MTVYLHCEGVTDYAVIPTLMKKASQKSDLEIQWVKKDVLKNVRTHRKSDIVISSHYKLVQALATVSRRDGCKNIAYHWDADHHYKDRYKAVDSEFARLRKASGFNCLAIIPKEAIESWLLADEKAYPKIPTNPALRKNPEDLWGDSHDPPSNHPKCYLSRVLKQFHWERNRDTYAYIAENSDIETVKRRCPVSFGRFCTDMQIFITGENDS